MFAALVECRGATGNLNSTPQQLCASASASTSTSTSTSTSIIITTTTTTHLPGAKHCKKSTAQEFEKS
ncbi:hypothetical protein E2C01_010221 [Portunus trituberculatus]|uniref:Uncharacterized protein n=1 Tax=Portunus trituberculatus TaxID=210409 RepID=A0A5B7D7T5_PORTR|nr:hypothetical protein [Portunus trituberculatus]